MRSLLEFASLLVIIIIVLLAVLIVHAIAVGRRGCRSSSGLLLGLFFLLPLFRSLSFLLSHLIVSLELSENHLQSFLFLPLPQPPPSPATRGVENHLQSSFKAVALLFSLSFSFKAAALHSSST